MLKVTLENMHTNWDAEDGEEDTYLVYAEEAGITGAPAQIEFNETVYLFKTKTPAHCVYAAMFGETEQRVFVI